VRRVCIPGSTCEPWRFEERKGEITAHMRAAREGHLAVETSAEKYVHFINQGNFSTWRFIRFFSFRRETSAGSHKPTNCVANIPCLIDGALTNGIESAEQNVLVYIKKIKYLQCVSACERARARARVCVFVRACARACVCVCVCTCVRACSRC
jgi:hypothetical protein